MEYMKQYINHLKLRRLSLKTISSYVNNLELTARRIGKPVYEIDEKDLANYILENKGKKLSSSTQMLIINSFKSFFSKIHKRKFDHDVLPRPKVEQKHPDILSKEEIHKLLELTTNLKHKTIIHLLYNGALRVSEVINLKVNDIDKNLNKINIRAAKGAKDRFVPLRKETLTLLRDYWMEYRTKEYLFEGAKGGIYSVTSVQNIVKKAAQKANINKKISTHSMRHSSITQMLKEGANIRAVQRFAGHKNIQSTANYVKLFDSDIMDLPNLF